MTKFKAGDWIKSNNGRGSTYRVETIETDGAPGRPGTWYYLNNGAVQVAKLARTGWHRAEQIDRTFKAVD